MTKQHHLKKENDAYEYYGKNDCSPFLFSVEHATNRLPSSISPTEKDQKFLSTHWGWDIGVKELTKKLVERADSRAIFANFSRLVIDPNRQENREDIIVSTVENHQLSFNQNLSPAEITQRKELYHAYHNAFDKMVAERCLLEQPFLLISIHSFTPIWNREIRTMDIGVLYDDYENIAIKLKNCFQAEGFFTALNQPYTGKNGLMFSVWQQGHKHQIPHLELEFNQTLLSSPQRIEMMADRVFAALQQLQANIRHGL